MGEYYVFNSETEVELFNSTSLSECRLFAEKYSSENCVHCTISHRFFSPEFYINGQRINV